MLSNLRIFAGFSIFGAILLCCQGNGGLLTGAFQQGPNGQVVAGSLENVTMSTQGALSKLGFIAVSTREGDAIRIKTKTKNGEDFSLVLTREKTPQGGEQTRIRVEGAVKAGDDVHLTLMSELSKTTSPGRSMNAN
jgi:hypothetical protein